MYKSNLDLDFRKWKKRVAIAMIVSVAIATPLSAWRFASYIQIKRNVISPLMLAITTGDPTKASQEIDTVLEFLESNNLSDGNICPVIYAPGLDCQLQEYHDVLKSQKRLVNQAQEADRFGNLLGKTNTMLLVNQNLRADEDSTIYKGNKRTYQSVKTPDNLRVAFQYGKDRVLVGHIVDCLMICAVIVGIISVLCFFTFVLIE